MKQKSSVALICCAFVALQAELKVEKTSQSYLFTPPVFTTLPARINAWHDSWFDLEKNIAIQATTHYRKSFRSEKLKNYFLMQNRDNLTIRGSANTNTSPTTDIRADWLGLPTNFQGQLFIKPEQEQFAVSFSARKSLTFEGVSLLDRMWVFCEMPVVKVKNNLNFHQEAVTNAAATTVTVHDIESAFNNPAWNYQKIKTTAQNKTHIGEIRLGFGKTFISDGRAHVASYSAISIPMTKKQNNEYLFSPQVGLNGHFAMIWGASFQLPITRKTDVNTTSLFLDFENSFLIRNTQYRTFDLKNKEWSRFLLLREKNQTTNTTTPGVNILTQKIRVSAYAIVNACTGIRFHVGTSEGEIGLGIWGRNQERLALTTPWQETYGIAGSTTNTSASVSTIKTLGADDVTFTTIKETNIDFASAATPETIVYRAHVAYGMHGRGKNKNGLCSFGMFVEIPNNSTTAFSQWGLWAKIGGAF